MIARIVGWSAHHPRTVLGVTAAFVIASAALAAQLQLDALPDVTNNQVLVLTRAPGLTPEEVERRVTRPLETSLGGLPGLAAHRSISRYGISSITAIFDDAVDPFRARQLVAERTSNIAASLPAGVEPPELGPHSGGLGEIFHFTLSSATRGPAELLELGTYRIAPQLRAVRGVVEVNTWGGERRTIDVVADPVRLAARGLTLDHLRRSLERATGSAPGATLPAGTGHVLLRAVARPGGPDDLAHALVVGTTVRLGEVADVRAGHLPRIGAATRDGRGETVYLMAQMLRGENALDVMDGIHARLPDIRKGLPDDVRLDVVYDRATLVHATLRTVGKNLLEGGLLVAVVLFALLGSVRAGLLVAAAIPLSMLGATAAMVVTSVPGNLMSLGAIDFGLIVDGAVVMVEHVFHALRGQNHGTAPDPLGGAPAPSAQGRAPFRERVANATRSVASPVFFSVLVILLVYIPVLTLTGVDGKMFRPMALTVVFALTTSLVLALTFVPAAAGALLRARDIPERDPLAARALRRAYEPALEAARRRPALVAAFALLLLGAGVFVYLRAGSEFIPQLDEGDLVVQTVRPPDISLATAVVEAGRVEAALRTLPEVAQVVTRTGSPAIATDIMGIEQADVFVTLRPKGAWRPGLSREDLIAEAQARIDAASPASEPSFTQPIQMRFNELLGGSVADVTISIYGDDLAELRRLAVAVADAVRPEPGAADVRVLAPPDVSLVEVRPRPLDAAQAGLSIAEVLDAVQAVRTGVEVGVTYDGPVRIPIVLRAGGDTTAFTIADLPLSAAGGGLVPLRRVADVTSTTTPGIVQHEGGERRLLVGVNIRGADLGVVVEGARARVESAVKLPRGYRVVWGGQYENLEDAARRLALVVPAVLVVILVVLLAAFRRLRPALIVFTHVPFAAVGGVLTLALRGMPVSISAAVGFIALGGVAVLNGVVLMSRILALATSGLDPAAAAGRAARERARPVVMTALVAALGFVPMMLARGVGAEVQRPLATVVVGGLVTSTLLTLLILPTVYPWLARRKRAAQPDAAAPPA